MTLEQAIAEARRRLDDVAAPQLWSDEDLTRFYNEAEREAAERGRLIRDHTTAAICEIAFVDGVSEYPLDKRVIDVKEVRVRGATCALDREGEEIFGRKLDKGVPLTFYVYDRGDTLVLVLDRPTPATLTSSILQPYLDLDVYRRPLVLMVNDTDSPEISANKHMDLLYWVQHLAYTTRDSDAGDVKRESVYADAFTQAFGIKIGADVRRKQIRHRPTIVRAYY